MLLPAKVAGAGRYSERLLAAIDHALEFAESDRPQTLAEWKTELAATSAARRAPTPKPAPVPPAPAARRGPLIWAASGAAAVIVAAAAIPWLGSLWREAPRSAVEQAEKPSAPEKSPNGELNGPLSDRLAALEHQLAEERNFRDEERQRRLEEERQRRLEEERQRRVDEERERRAKQQPKPAVAARTPKHQPKQEPVPQAPAPVARIEPPKPEPAKPEPPMIEVAKVEPPKLIEPPPKLVDQPKPVVERKVDPLANADRAFVEGNYSEALGVLKPLAEKNNPKAQLRLGRLYLEGLGVERNEAEAVRLFRKAAEQGENEARLRLGDMYANGRGVPQSNFQAYVWYGVAAREGNVAAKNNQDRVGATMQPMEVRQAGKLIDSLVAAAKTQ
jgi:TolA-binding protein